MMRTTMDPYGGCTLPVDKMIGDAYPNVEIVARHIDEVAYLVANMEAIVALASNLQIERTYYATGVAPAIGLSASIPYPAGVTQAKLRGMSVILVDVNGVAHLPGSNFTAVANTTALLVNILPGAPLEMVGGAIRWHMTASL